MPYGGGCWNCPATGVCLPLVAYKTILSSYQFWPIKVGWVRRSFLFAIRPIKQEVIISKDKAMAANEPNKAAKCMVCIQTALSIGGENRCGCTFWVKSFKFFWSCTIIYLVMINSFVLSGMFSDPDAGVVVGVNSSKIERLRLFVLKQFDWGSHKSWRPTQANNVQWTNKFWPYSEKWKAGKKAIRKLFRFDCVPFLVRTNGPCRFYHWNSSSW